MTSPESATKENSDTANHSASLVSPLTIRSVELRNRIVVSPMCQYSATDGFTNDWHLVHLGSRAAGGAGLVFVEATAVTADGRITPGDTGIWKDEQIDGLQRIAKFVNDMGAASGIQLAHAGRKASCDLPWKGGARLQADQGGWTTVAPSAIPFNEKDPAPKQLTKDEIASHIESFRVAAKRAVAAGFRIIEIHSAHGYLLHEFLSPLANKREDEYGGSLENRSRFLLQVVEAVREVIPNDMPLFVRISCTDWVEGGWDIEQSVAVSKLLKSAGVDLIDCSSGALVPYAVIPAAKNYQVPFAERIRKEAEIATGAVGLIIEPEQANEIIESGKSDLVFLAREMLREPYWALKAEKALGANQSWPTQYGYAVRRK